MSDTIIEAEAGEEAAQAVSTADLERMLEESRNRASSLERERDEERNARQRTERERDEVAGHAHTETERRYNAELQAVDGGLIAARAEADHAEEAYAAALEAGDFKGAAKMQRVIAEATTRAVAAQSKKEWLESNKDQITRAAPTRQAAREDGDEYDKLVTDLRPAEKAWLKDRSKFLTDPSYRNQVYGASQLAVGRGHERGTDAYFRFMERVLEEGSQETRQEPTRQEPARETRQERAPSSDIAPARRPAPGAQSPGSREIRLSADEAEVANNLYGNPSSPDFIADEGDRFRKYHANRERMRSSGRL